MNQFEAEILTWIQNNVRLPALNGIVSAISHLGDVGIFWICTAIALLVFKKTRKLGFVCVGSMLLTMLIVNCALKPIVARIRPYELEAFKGVLQILVPKETDFSFPSGHTSNSFSCAWVLFRMDRKRFGIPALVLGILISLSRLYVGVHYLSDVLAGAVIGILCAEAAIRFVPGWVETASKKLKRDSATK